MRNEVYEVLRNYDNGDYGNIDIYANLYTTKDENDILVIDDWDSVRKLEKIFNEIVKDEEDYEKRQEDEYDTSAVDYITEGNWTFSDEGFMCDECCNWYFYDNRNGACSYANYKIYDGWIECEDCIRDNPDNYLREIINNPEYANTILDNQQLRDLGFEKVNDEPYDNGWYGWNKQDDPKKILSKAQAQNANAEYLFSIRKTYNPWEIEWDLWKRETA